jgi:hypothetical protein
MYNINQILIMTSLRVMLIMRSSKIAFLVIRKQARSLLMLKLVITFWLMLFDGYKA